LQDVLASIGVFGLQEPELSQLRGQLQSFQGKVITPDVSAAIRAAAETFRPEGATMSVNTNSTNGSTTMMILFGRRPVTAIVAGGAGSGQGRGVGEGQGPGVGPGIGGSLQADASPDVVRIRVGGAVLQANLVQSVPPVYPDLARVARIQGIVVLEAIIDVQGRVTDLRVVSGHPLFIQPAIDAVRQWIYRPIMLNGEPREVVSTVTVNFSLQE
jgi:TonB family protein